MASRVGGVVSETSFKFFIQFVGWTAIYCIFNLVIAAYFLAEYKRKVRGFYQFFIGVRTRLQGLERQTGNDATTTWYPCLMFLVLSASLNQRR